MPKARGRGGPVVDPTLNVIALNDAASKRQDDLRDSNNRRIDSELRCIRREAKLRAAHAKAVSALETNRLDAIRSVDVLAVSTAFDRSLAAIQTLAATTTVNAENLRNALNTTATTIATQTASTMGAVIDRIAALEKTSYEGSGKTAGIGASWAVLLGAIATLLALAAYFKH